MSLERIWIPSPNCSSRSGASVRMLVLHTAEGAQTYGDLGRYFQQPVDASSHVGIDDTPNVIGEYVRHQDKAWTCAQYNPVSLNVELCAFSAWSLDTWHQHPQMLRNCATWIAEEAQRYGIPIEELTDAEARGSGRGVCQHKQLGTEGGGHSDCGPEFPMAEVLNMARGGDAVTPPTQEEIDMAIAACVKPNGCIEVFVHKEDGSVMHTWQVQENGGWKGSEPGKTAAWYSLGKPGK